MARHFPSRDGRGSVVFCKRGEVCLDLLNDLFLREGTLSLHLLCGFCRPGVVRRIYFFFLLYTVWLRVLSPMCRHLTWKCKYIPFRQFNGVAGKGYEKYNVHGIKKLKEK